MILSSGAKVGHRSLMRYYKQKFGIQRAVVLAHNQKAVGRVLKQYRALGWGGDAGEGPTSFCWTSSLNLGDPTPKCWLFNHRGMCVVWLSLVCIHASWLPVMFASQVNWLRCSTRKTCSTCRGWSPSGSWRWAWVTTPPNRPTSEHRSCSKPAHRPSHRISTGLWSSTTVLKDSPLFCILQCLATLASSRSAVDRLC